MFNRWYKLFEEPYSKSVWIKSPIFLYNRTIVNSICRSTSNQIFINRFWFIPHHRWHRFTCYIPSFYTIFSSFSDHWFCPRIIRNVFFIITINITGGYILYLFHLTIYFSSYCFHIGTYPLRKFATFYKTTQPVISWHILSKTGNGS